MPAPVYETQRAGQQMLFTLNNLQNDLTDGVINALTGWDNFSDAILALTVTKDSDQKEQRRRHALNIKTHVKAAAVGASGAAQVETATVGGGATASANVIVTVTAAGMTGSPKAINVAVTNGDTAAQVAAKIRTALAADSAVAAMFQVGGAGATVTLTRNTPAANDATLNIGIDGSTNGTGVPNAATSANTTAGSLPGITAADAVVVAWTNRADAISFAKGLAAWQPPGDAIQSNFIQ